MGQALMQAGSSPTPTRSEHSVHLWTFLVSGLNFGNQVRQHLRRCNTSCYPHYNTDKNQSQPVSQDQADNVTAARSKRQPDTHFVRALRSCIGHNSVETHGR